MDSSGAARDSVVESVDGQAGGKMDGEMKGGEEEGLKPEGQEKEFVPEELLRALSSALDGPEGSKWANMMMRQAHEPGIGKTFFAIGEIFRMIQERRGKDARSEEEALRGAIEAQAPDQEKRRV